MPAVTRLGDLDTGHDACPPRGLSSASGNVFVNGKGCGRINDTYPAHGCVDHVPHSGAISSGSATVFVNGRNCARIGDAVSCGGSVAQGSGNVFAN